MKTAATSAIAKHDGENRPITTALSAPGRRGQPVVGGRSATVVGWLAGHHVVHTLGDVHRVVTDPLVEPADDSELHRGLKIEPARGVRLEDGLDEVVVELVEDVVHVVQGSRERGVTLDVGVEGPAEQLLRLGAHPGDQAADLRDRTCGHTGAARPCRC